MSPPFARAAAMLTAGALAATGCGGSPAPGSPSDGGTSPDVSTDAGAIHTGAAHATVTHYDYALDLATRVATVGVTLRVTSAGDCLSIGYRAGDPSAVTLGGLPARNVQVTNGVLTACDGGGRGWAEGTMVTLSVTGTVPLQTLHPTQVGYSVRMDREGHPFTYLLGWVGECDRFGACDASPSAFATYRFTVTHPAGTRVLCPGVITAGDTVTTCDFAYDGGPTYSAFGIAAGQSWQEVPLGQQSGVTITLYDTASTGIAAALDQTAVRGFLGWMTDTFGRYPYGSDLRLVVGPTYWAGFEHPGNIVLAETLVRGGRLDHTVLHETAHQWAGDQTTLATIQDFAWKESMAEYLSFVYEDSHISHAAGQTTAQTWKVSAWIAATYPVPATPQPLLSYYNAAYGPGPMILFRQLEVLYSRDAVVGALRHLLGSAHAISVDDVRAALEASTGAHLTTYMNAWIRGTGAPAWPRATVTQSPSADGGITVSVRLATADGVARGCRFTVQLRGAMGETLDVPVDFGVDGTATPTATVHPTFTVTNAVVDPYTEALVWAADTTTGSMLALPRPGTGSHGQPAEFWRAPSWDDPPVAPRP